ncbi:succinylglutamate desuccinylase [Enterobacteriaceae bacterium LUAb1]
MQPFLDVILNRAAGPSGGETPALYWQWRHEGILEMVPKQPVSHALVLSCGIHGNETAPVEIVAALADQLLAGAVRLRVRLLVIVGNPSALRAGKRYLQYDMNRLFGGRWQRYQESEEAHRACLLEQTLERFFLSSLHHETRWHLDLHTAIRGSYHRRFGVMPLNVQPWPADFLHWLAAAALEALVFHTAPGGTFTHFSCERFAVASCTLELGKALPFGHNELAQFSAVQQALTALLLGENLPDVTVSPMRYRVVQQLTRRREDFVLHMSAETLNFTAFSQGTLLAEEGGEQYRVHHDCEYVLFPNPDVAPGLRAGLMLVKEQE